MRHWKNIHRKNKSKPKLVAAADVEKKSDKNRHRSLVEMNMMMMMFLLMKSQSSIARLVIQRVNIMFAEEKSASCEYIEQKRNEFDEIFNN